MRLVASLLVKHQVVAEHRAEQQAVAQVAKEPELFAVLQKGAEGILREDALLFQGIADEPGFQAYV